MILLILIMKKRLISILLFIIYRNTMLYLCLYVHFETKDIIQNDIVNYSIGKFNKKDILFGIKLIIRNELVSYHYKFKTLFLVLTI